MEPTHTEDPNADAPPGGRHRSEDVGTALHHQGRHRLTGDAGTPTQKARWNGATAEQALIDANLREATT